MLNKSILEQLRQQHPVDCCVELLYMNDAFALPAGTRGTVTGIDDAGSIMVNWDNCSGLNVLYSIDRMRKVADSDDR